MNRYPLWKYVVILIMLLIGSIYSLPNLFGEAPAVQVSSGKATIKLDNAALTRVEQVLQTEGLQASMIQMEGNSIKARFNDTDTQLKARDALEKAFNPDPADPSHVVALNLLPRTPAWLQALHASPMYLGLDLRGGVH
ncbi:MAG: protein translocase subunit SecD, partial [Polaromonas sp.]|nr:protein translocase subunit SecD [Polaromonas sp.]